MTWYIDFCSDNPLASLANTKAILNKDFSKPKYNSQSVVVFKEIIMRVNETLWELDQRLKCQIREANM